MGLVHCVFYRQILLFKNILLIFNKIPKSIIKCNTIKDNGYRKRLFRKSCEVKLVDNTTEVN